MLNALLRTPDIIIGSRRRRFYKVGPSLERVPRQSDGVRHVQHLNRQSTVMKNICLINSVYLKVGDVDTVLRVNDVVHLQRYIRKICY